MVLRNIPNIIEELHDIQRNRFLGDEVIYIYDNGHA